MGYFDGIVSGTIVARDDGSWSFFPYGRLFEGYRLPDEIAYRHARAATLVYIVSGAVVTFVGLKFAIAAAILAFLVVTFGYVGWARRFGARFERVRADKTSRGKRFRRFADATGARVLWTILVVNGLFLGMSIWVLVVRGVSTTALSSVGFFGLGFTIIGIAAVDQWRRRSSRVRST